MQLISQNKIKAKLGEVIDPELNVNIVDLGLIYNIQISKASDVKVTMTLTTSGCPMASLFEIMVKEKTRELKGVKNVTVNIVFDPPWTPDMMAPQTRIALGY